MEIAPEKIGLLTGVAASLVALWKSFTSSNEKAKQKADERTLELFKMHVFPKLDAIGAEVTETKHLCEDVMPRMAGEIVKQSIESANKQVFDTAQALIKLRTWEGK